jgi:hypothetical protein
MVGPSAEQAAGLGFELGVRAPAEVHFHVVHASVRVTVSTFKFKFKFNKRTPGRS